MRSLRAASCGIGVNALAATSVVYIGSLYLQNALGYSAMESALAIIPINVLGFIVALVGAPARAAIPAARARDQLHADRSLASLARASTHSSQVPDRCRSAAGRPGRITDRGVHRDDEPSGLGGGCR